MILVAFLYLAAMIVGTSLLVVTSRNPVHSVLWMLLMFFHVAGMYLFLNAEFFAAVQVLVYAGAILVLFLFVILLLDLKKEEFGRRYTIQWPNSLVIAGSVLIVLLMATTGIEVSPIGMYSIEYVQRVGHIKALGELLYTDYLFPFEVVSLILLVAMIGAIVLAKKNLKA